MTFIPHRRIETRASELWQRYRLVPGFDVEQLLDEMELDLLWQEVDDHDQDGEVLGQLIPGNRLVVLNERHRDRLEQNGGKQRRFTIGHELGHWTLHSEAVRSGTLNLFDGERILCRERSPHPVERQAERFAGSLLMPRDWLLSLLPRQPWRGWRSVYRLSDQFVVTPTAMIVRLEELNLGYRDENGMPTSGPKIAPGQMPLFN
jgi:hypothetical protein